MLVTLCNKKNEGDKHKEVFIGYDDVTNLLKIVDLKVFSTKKV